MANFLLCALCLNGSRSVDDMRQAYANLATASETANPSQEECATVAERLLTAVTRYSDLGPEEMPIDTQLKVLDDDCVRKHRALYACLVSNASEETRAVLIKIVQLINKQHTDHANATGCCFRVHDFIELLRDTLHASEAEVNEAVAVYHAGRARFACFA